MERDCQVKDPRYNGCMAYKQIWQFIENERNWKNQKQIKKGKMHIWIHKIQDASMVMKGRGRMLPLKTISKMFLREL